MPEQVWWNGALVRSPGWRAAPPRDRRTPHGLSLIDSSDSPADALRGKIAFYQKKLTYYLRPAVQRRNVATLQRLMAELNQLEGIKNS